jgi:hypothetical protein
MSTFLDLAYTTSITCFSESGFVVHWLIRVTSLPFPCLRPESLGIQALNPDERR